MAWPRLSADPPADPDDVPEASASMAHLSQKAAPMTDEEIEAFADSCQLDRELTKELHKELLAKKPVSKLSSVLRALLYKILEAYDAGDPDAVAFIQAFAPHLRPEGFKI